MDLGLREERKVDPEIAAEIAKEVVVAKKRKTIVVITLIAGFIVAFTVAKIEKYSILSPFSQRLADGLGGVVGIGVFAGIPAAILWKRGNKTWLLVFSVIAAILISSQIVVYVYEASSDCNKPTVTCREW